MPAMLMQQPSLAICLGTFFKRMNMCCKNNSFVTLEKIAAPILWGKRQHGDQPTFGDICDQIASEMHVEVIVQYSD